MKNNRSVGVAYAILAYFIWGLSPLYWKLLSEIAPMELLCHRVFWAFLFVFFTLALRGNLGELFAIFKKKKGLGLFIVRTFLLATNWYTYVWAISNDRLLEASLGYYLNPLVSIFLGMIFLGERLSKPQWVAVGFAAIGVAFKTILAGGFPVVSVVVAFSFGFYGLMKKKNSEGSVVGMGMETLILLPLVFAYLIFSDFAGFYQFLYVDFGTKLLLVSAGLITIVPLIIFSKGLRRIPLTWIGFLQFLAPTIMFFFGLFLYKESFLFFDFFAFVLVWVGVAIFLFSSIFNRLRA